MIDKCVLVLVGDVRWSLPCVLPRPQVRPTSGSLYQVNLALTGGSEGPLAVLSVLAVLLELGWPRTTGGAAEGGNSAVYSSHAGRLVFGK